MDLSEVVSQWTFERLDDPVLNNEDIVDRDGYRDTETTIMEMINAGERLNRFRKGEFDIEEEEEFENVEDNIDITRNGYDMADAYQDIRALENQVKEYNKNVEKAKNESKDKVIEEKKVEEGE